MTTSHVTIDRMQVRYAIVLEPESERGFSVSIPALPEAHTQGETVEEAIANAREAALAVVTDRHANGEAIPPSDADAVRIEHISVAMPGLPDSPNS
jgi:predicted RNase H-like HicB family nuclease